jgi:hypothetical protein
MQLRHSLALLVFAANAACGSSGQSSTDQDAGTAGHPLASNAGHGGNAGATGGAGHAGSAAGAASKTTLSGTLGALGDVEATDSSLVISNGREVLIYLSSGALTCDQIKTSRWLGSVPAGTQIVEIVVPAAKTSGTVMVGQGAEVNYAEGGKSSSYEKGAKTGSVTFESFEPSGPTTGTVTATYDTPAANVMGTFHADFCQGGQEF